MIQLLLNLGKIIESFLDMKYVSLYYNLDFWASYISTFEKISYVSLFYVMYL